MTRFLILLLPLFLLGGCVTTKTPEERGAYRINKVKVIAPNVKHGALVAKQLTQKFNRMARESAKWVPAGTSSHELTIALTKIKYTTVLGFKGSANGYLNGYFFIGPKANGVVHRFKLSGDPGKGTFASLSVGFNKYYSPEWVFNRLADRLVYRFKKEIYLINDRSYFDKITDAPTVKVSNPNYASQPQKRRSVRPSQVSNGKSNGISPPPPLLIGG
ncbi:hypothetical protein SAMN04515695_0563 [Pseudovibrio sp. Tun.PSC04-5.I4]|nr:hypothetical protein SAMN04515695_0563 [Pseudovibrio sp. Tun.PSC04-5.I4]